MSIFVSSPLPHADSDNSTGIVRWVSESLHPFSIVSDCGFNNLMKTGRPSHWIPSPTTVSRDVKKVFANVRRRLAVMLQVREISKIQ